MGGKCLTFLFAAFIFYDLKKTTFLTANNIGYNVCILDILQCKRDRENKTRKLDHRGNNRIYTPYSIYRALSSFETSDVDVTKQLLQFWFCSSLKYYLIITAFMRFREIKLNGMGNVLYIHSGVWVVKKLQIRFTLSFSMKICLAINSYVKKKIRNLEYFSGVFTELFSTRDQYNYIYIYIVFKMVLTIHLF